MKKFWVLPLAGLALFAFSNGPVLAQGDAAAGEKVFKKCHACHSLEEGVNKTGPSLYHVVGRKAGSTDFKRYKGLVGADFTWDEANLNEYLTDPNAFVKANTANKRSGMAFKLKDPQQRADVIAYLKSLQ